MTPYFKWTAKTAVADLLEVMISNKADLKDFSGNLFAIKLRGHTDSSGMFAVERKVFLLFFEDGKEINKSDIITIEKGEEVRKEYEFDSHQQIEIKVLDANTREQLDKVTVSKSAARDFGGLL